MKCRDVLLAGAAVGALVVGVARAQVGLPCFSDFSADTVGMTPTLGGPDNPTDYLRTLGTESLPLVQASSLGLDSKPVTFSVGAEPMSGAMLVYDFAPNVTTMVLRAEATVSVSEFTHLTIMRSWQNAFGGALGDVTITSAGEIFGRGGQVGVYVPSTPFRVRMDVKVLSGEYCVTVDNELDGFGNDGTIDGLEFLTDPLLVDNVGGFGIGYFSGSDAMGTTVAFDDVSIMLIPTPGTVVILMAGAGVVLVGRHRR